MQLSQYCRQLCAVTLELQTIVRGIQLNFRNLLGGFLVSLETLLSLKDQGILCMPFILTFC